MIFGINRCIVTLLPLLLLFSCREYADSLYEVVDMDANNADNTNEPPILVTSDSVAKKSYAIHLEYTMLYRGVENDEVTNPNENDFRNINTTTSFNVYSLNTFDSIHPAGSSLNDYFLVSSGSPYGSTNTISSIIIKNQIGKGEYSGDVLDTWKSDQYLILMQPPTLNGTYSFVVDIKQSNNNSLIDTVTVRLY